MQGGTYSSATRKLVKTSVPGIYKRGNRYVVRYRDSHGRQHKAFARTLAEARVVKSTLSADVARGEYRELSRIKFSEYALSWIETYQGRTSRGIRPATLTEYQRDLERDAIPFFGRMRLTEIEPRTIKQYAAHIAARGVSPNTVRLAIAPVRVLLATAFEEGLIRSNPAAGVRIAQRVGEDADASKPKALTETELRRLIGELPEQHRLFVEFLAHTGLRIGEAVALRWGDVDFGRRRVQVRRRLYQGELAPPKSRYGRRDVPLSPGMAQHLWTLRSARRPEDAAPLFPSLAGTPIDPSNFARILKRAAHRAGVGWASFHTLRHTCATMLFRRGLNAKQVQVWLGHHSPAFTLATYVHLLAEDLPNPAFLDGVTRPDAGSVSRERIPLTDSRASDEALHGPEHLRSALSRSSP